jgi:hypothetical protein
MDIIENILAHFEKYPLEANGEAPEGLCPVCWGYQQYDQKIRILFRDKQIDVNNHRDKYLLVQDFIKKHIDGIHLAKGKIETCQQCENQDFFC